MPTWMVQLFADTVARTLTNVNQALASFVTSAAQVLARSGIDLYQTDDFNRLVNALSDLQKSLVNQQRTGPASADDVWGALVEDAYLGDRTTQNSFLGDAWVWYVDFIGVLSANALLASGNPANIVPTMDKVDPTLDPLFVEWERTGFPAKTLYQVAKQRDADLVDWLRELQDWSAPRPPPHTSADPPADGTTVAQNDGSSNAGSSSTSGAPQTGTTPGGQPPSPPSPSSPTVVNDVDPSTAPVHPNPGPLTTQRTRPKQYVAGTNILLPDGSTVVPQIPHSDDGIITTGGNLFGTQALPGSLPDLGLGPPDQWPGFNPQRRRSDDGRGGGPGTGPGYSPTPSGGGAGQSGGTGGGYQTQNNQDPSSGGGAHFSGDSGGGAPPAPGGGGGPARGSAPAPDPPKQAPSTDGSSDTGSKTAPQPQSGPDPETTPDDPNKKAEPNPDDPDSGNEGPSIHNGMGGGPHGGTTRVRPPMPDPGSLGQAALLINWRSTGEGGDWGGNPHENPDPEDSGGSMRFNPTAIALNNVNPDDLGTIPMLPVDTGDNADEFWGGNNPHYMPYGVTSWTPYSNTAAVTKLQRAALTTRAAISRSATIRFKP